MLSPSLLKRIVKGWKNRARVRADLDFDIDFYLEKDDFLVECLPFKDHPFFINSSPAERAKILTCGWIIYNAKTITIETDIVYPVCMSILAEEFAGSADFLIKQMITETLVDESYHIHLCTYGNEITKQNRGLTLHLAPFEFIKKMRMLQNQYSQKWQKAIIQLAASIVSEIYITDYLNLAKKEQNNNIQPLNSLIVKTHRSDELTHGKIFTYLAHELFHHFNKKQKEFFAEVLPKPLVWLSDQELDLWLHVLNQINFPGPQEMINDCKSLHSQQISQSICTNDGTIDLISLASALGVMDLEIGKQSFYREGILI